MFFAICVSLSLTGCSLVVDPQFPDSETITANTRTPSSDASVDMDMSATDMAQMQDQAVMDPDLGIDMMAVQDASVLEDAMLPPSRVCESWSGCYSGESCLEIGEDLLGVCGPTTGEEICVEGNGQPNVPASRSYTGECCIPDDGEIRGECVFPYTLSFDTREVLPLDASGTLGVQFSGGECLSGLDQFPKQSDVIFISTVGEMLSTDTLCVETSLMRNENLDFQLFRLDSCCEQTQTYTAEHCGFAFDASDTTNQRFLNIPYTGQTTLRFGLRIGSASDDTTTSLLEGPLPMNYKVHAGPCCNADHPCPEGFSCEAGICE